MTNLTQLIEQWIGEEKETDLGANRHNIGYNRALQDIKSKIPDLLEQIVQLIEGEKFADTSEAGQFSMHSDGYNQGIEDIIYFLKTLNKDAPKK